MVWAYNLIKHDEKESIKNANIQKCSISIGFTLYYSNLPNEETVWKYEYYLHISYKIFLM